MIAEGEHLWDPRPDFKNASNVMRYIAWLAEEKGLAFSDYNALWQWSVKDIEGFWESIWEYFRLHSITPYTQVLDTRAMPGGKWFEGSRVNYAEHLLRFETVTPKKTALHYSSELHPPATMSWSQLGGSVRLLATRLRALGITPGDRVVSYLPNVPETVIAMMATVSIGAIWSAAAPEFGVKTVIERFAQIQPKILFAGDGYRFAGKDYSRSAEVQAIVAGLPTLQHVVWLPYLLDDQQAPVFASLDSTKAVSIWNDLLQGAPIAPADFRYEYVEHDHPLWVVFSSGTTGLPKAIVHSHVGTLVEHSKLMAFHLNLTSDSTMCFYTTTGWMMWNLLVSALLAGSAIILYDGSPTHPEVDFLWQLAAQTGATNMGASPTFVQMMVKAGANPGEKYDLSRLDSILVAGAPSTPETFEWFYSHVKKDLWVTSQSGGTEICSGFVGASPTLPVYAGEIQARMLGMDVHAWSDDGRELFDEVGELVVTSPFPSMPIKLWNDAEGKRYHEAYFDVFPGVWRHGDFIKINHRGGCYIYGRSDSTLNRHGVRIGTAEVYRAIELVPEVADSLVVCCELPGGKYFMPMFVRLKPNVMLDDALIGRINSVLREECSPRHVPDRIYEIEQIPYTLTGKKMEVPVRKILMGWPLEKAASRDAMTNPASIDWFVTFANESTDYVWRVPAKAQEAAG